MLSTEIEQACLGETGPGEGGGEMKRGGVEIGDESIFAVAKCFFCVVSVCMCCEMLRKR